jgi:hypothetical protein
MQVVAGILKTFDPKYYLDTKGFVKRNYTPHGEDANNRYANVLAQCANALQKVNLTEDIYWLTLCHGVAKCKITNLIELLAKNRQLWEFVRAEVILHFVVSFEKMAVPGRPVLLPNTAWRTNDTNRKDMRGLYTDSNQLFSLDDITTVLSGGNDEHTDRAVLIKKFFDELDALSRQKQDWRSTRESGHVEAEDQKDSYSADQSDSDEGKPEVGVTHEDLGALHFFEDGGGGGLAPQPGY